MVPPHTYNRPLMNRVGVAILSFLLGLIVLPFGALLYLAYGRPPVAVADNPFPFEDRVVQVPLRARIRSDMPAGPPIQPDDDNLNAGAQTYEDKCEFCHGINGKPSSTGGSMFPRAPQLFVKHRNDAVGVSNDPAGAIFWRIKNGIRLTGMPAYGKSLSDTEIWQVSLLLSRADKPLPAEASKTLGITQTK